ncbi:MAG TPA: ABC transporter permease [Candidatus Polarisedimenticolia bacterium]|jgi:predicted permease|nr:ABC transporter permease [Candidatus Polarisedimenticolia bacterium]
MMILDDFRLAVRRLLRSPVFTFVTVAALALGVGMNTAIFSVVNAALLRPLPYPRADRLVEVALPSASGEARGPVSFVDFQDWRQQQGRLFSSMAVFSTLAGLNLRGEGDREPEQLKTAFVDPAFFATLGVVPEIGRPLVAPDNEPGRNQAVVISHGLWQRRFDGDPAIAGRTVTLDEQAFTVAGVMPASFRFPDAAIDAWAPESLIEASAAPRVRGNRFQRVIARLDEGVSVEQARTGMDLIAARLAREFPETNTGRDRVTLLPLHESLVGGRLRSAVLVLLAAVGLVLLIACANVAHLLIARIASRRRETAIRLALGASPSAVVRLQVAESLVVSLAGGLLGLLLAAWTLDLVRSGVVAYLPPQLDVVLDRRVLGFAFLASIAAALLSGVLPALRSAGRGGVAAQDLKEGTRGTGAGGDRRRLREALVVSELALAVVLVVAAGLAIESFRRLSGVDPGFEPDGVLTVAMNASGARYPERAQFVDFQRRVVERVQRLPGVVAAGATRNLPLLGTGESWPIVPEGSAPVAPGDEPQVWVHPVSAGFFAALRIPLVEGRTFSESETAPVAVASQALARRFWPDGHALGRALLVGDKRIPIVGVVGDVRQGTIESEGEAALYLPSGLSPRRGFTLVIRTAGTPGAMESLVRAAVREVDPQQPILRVATMRDVLGSALSQPRLMSGLLGAFGVLALLLAVLGVYGVIALMVSLRTYEFGVRMALGASAGAVRRMVLQRAVFLGALGVGCGTLVALGATRLLRSQLYDVSATDPAAFLFAAAVLLVASLLAGDGPARRATRIDPLVALRSD